MDHDPVEQVLQQFREATQSVEQIFASEDSGWINLASWSASGLPSNERNESVQRARIYSIKDPLAKQALRLWTDYTFGTGMTYKADDDKAQAVLDTYWKAPENHAILSAIGQRNSSRQLLVDGEIFFALFLGDTPKLRTIDPLEIAEIITDPEDAYDVRYYKRVYTTPQGSSKAVYYRSTTNEAGEPTPDAQGATQSTTDGPLVYHLAIDPMGLRGTSLLLPAIEWIRQYRRFLAARIAIMLALSRFAWKTKVQTGAAGVATVKGALNDKTPAGGSALIESLGSDTQPIRTDSNARGAYDDARMIRLQICAAFGIPEQYFGDISIGNLATAKTVELPLQKMFESYQTIWADTYDHLDRLVLANAGIPEDKLYVDRDFPPITPADGVQLAQSIGTLLAVLPQLADSDAVMQQALLALGINDINEVLEQIMPQEAGSADPAVEAAIALRKLTRKLGISLNGKEPVHVH